LCCVFDLLFFVLYNLRWQFLWIVHFWLPLRYSLELFPPIWTKRTKSSHTIPKYHDRGNPDPGLEQAQTVAGFNWLMGSKPSPFGNCIYLCIPEWRSISFVFSLMQNKIQRQIHIIILIFTIVVNYSYTSVTWTHLYSE
jgi:hypothetical protein